MKNQELSTFAIKNPTLRNIDRNVKLFEKDRHALLRYILHGFPRGGSDPRYWVLGRHVNQIAASVGLLPIINGREWRLNDRNFCNLQEIDNIQEILLDFMFLHCKCWYRNGKVSVHPSAWRCCK